MPGTERSLCTRSVGAAAAVCGSVAAVRCVVTGVWPLTPGRRLPVCLSLCLSGPMFRYT
ncbi:hypothetical protein JOB18_000753 [Solea senegalensis]|uniref:Secreted protein n=1 Tax=Solea senegalensis TaxID=28829 RepID=A0AAV6QLX2_SOLSE|nr:hypothetical protein JOB18_000753 [Solea senegalensis]